MKLAATKAAEGESKLLDRANGSFLKAINQKMLRKKGRVDYAKLRKQGFSPRFLAKLEES